MFFCFCCPSFIQLIVMVTMMMVWFRISKFLNSIVVVFLIVEAYCNSDDVQPQIIGHFMVFLAVCMEEVLESFVVCSVNIIRV